MVFGKLLTWLIAVEVVVLAAAGAWAYRQHVDREQRPEPANVPERPSSPAGAPKRASRATPPDRPQQEQHVVDPQSTPPLPLLRRPRVIVHKSALKLDVYDGATLVKTYRVAIGADRADKVRSGDQRTPEGEFYLCLRKKAPDTPYFRSLGLSYPNVEDADRGLRDGLINTAQHRQILQAIARRLRPPWNTPLGGAIMIHGSRNGRDGTLGCVALDDDDIRELYLRLPMGTPVTIQP